MNLIELARSLADQLIVLIFQVEFSDRRIKALN